MTARAWARRTVGLLVGIVRRRPTAGRILLYHRLGGGHPALDVPAEVFRRQLDAIAAAGCRCVSVSTAVRARFPAGMVALSFDDGDASVEAACAEVIDRGGGATVFLVPAWTCEGRAGHIDWSAARDLVTAGIEIGTHGWDHRRLCGDPVRARAEMIEARVRTEHEIGLSVTGMAYPFGLAPPATRAAALDAGYEYACGTVPGVNRASDDPFALHRNEIFAADGSPGLVIGKLAGSDDWFGPIRELENAIRCRR